MNPQEAKQILLLYRPGSADAEDAQTAEAIEVARHSPELARWFEQHCAFQTALQTKLRQIVPPPDLKAALLARQKIVPLRPAWQRPAYWVAAAAALVLFLSLAGLWLRPPGSDRFANFQSRMVATALREYRMDLVTNDMGQVRQFLAAHGAPADYDLTGGLAKLDLTGGGLLRWRSHPVTMVCFNRGDNQMLYLFVLNRSALKDPPPERPQLAKMNDLITASWTHGDKTYVLAGPEETDFARKYLSPSS